MGISTDAILFYGIDLGDDFTEKINSKKILKEWEEYEEDEDEDGDFYSFIENLIEKLELKNIKIGYHCSDSCKMYYLSSIDFTASRGNPENIELKELINPPDLINFKKLLDILEIKEEPKWNLVSWWG